MLKFNARKSRSYGITLIKRKSHTTRWQVSSYQETISILNQSTFIQQHTQKLRNLIKNKRNSGINVKTVNAGSEPIQIRIESCF